MPRFRVTLHEIQTNLHTYEITAGGPLVALAEAKRRHGNLDSGSAADCIDFELNADDAHLVESLEPEGAQ